MLNKYKKEYVALVKDASGTITNSAVFHDLEAMNAWFRKHYLSGLFIDKELSCVIRRSYNGKPILINWQKVIAWSLIVVLALFIAWRLK